MSRPGRCAVLLIAAAIAVWAWKQRAAARGSRFGDVAAIVAALLALRLLTRGEWLPALVGARLGGRLAVAPARRGAAGRRRERAAMPLDEARGLLELPADADARDDPRRAPPPDRAGPSRRRRLGRTGAPGQRARAMR